jgi:DNA adenine methylase
MKNSRYSEKFFKEAEKIIDKYNLSCSYKKDTIPFEMKREFKKTYYARFNKQDYEKLRVYANNFRNNNPLIFIYFAYLRI